MRPDKAASVFRELLQTPIKAFGHFAQRTGLHTNPNHQDLVQAQELLQAIACALESAPGPNWESVRAAWTGMRSKVGAVHQPAVAKPPAWVRDALPARPSLGDPAPGTEQRTEQEQQRARFVPVAQPQFVPPPAAAPAPPPVAPPPAPPVAPVAQPAYGGSYAQQAPHAAPQATPPAPPPAPPRRPPPPPQRQAAQVDLSGWSVSRYASFCAACAAFPTRVAQTQLEYGLPDDASRAQLDDLWQDRFDDDPAMQSQWEQTFRQFREQLQKRGY